MTHDSNQGRRDFIRTMTAASAAGALSLRAPGEARAAGGGKIRIGIIPLTDCASVVMAHELGLYKKHGVDVEVSKEASWANVRDKLLTGELQAAHCLFGMPFSVYNGIGGPKGKELKIAMMLNNNGQATTLANENFGGKVGYGDFTKLKAVITEMHEKKKEPTFAMTFPGGTHDLWMRLTLATAGVKPSSVRIITIPPPQMVANMKVGNMDGFNVGEPWGGVAVKQGIGFTFIATQDLWKHHPEKALVCNPEFASGRRDDLKKVMKAILEASAWLDIMKNRDRASKVIGAQSYVNAPSDVIDERLLGNYDLGKSAGRHSFKDDTMMFHRGGATNFPRQSHGIWFMTQYVRFGYLKEMPDAKSIAKKLLMQDLYREVAKEMKIAVPADDMKPFAIKVEKIPFDPNAPAAYVKHFREGVLA